MFFARDKMRRSQADSSSRGQKEEGQRDSPEVQRNDRAAVTLLEHAHLQETFSPKALLESMACLSKRDGHKDHMLPSATEDKKPSESLIDQRLDEISAQLAFLARQFERSKLTHATDNACSQETLKEVQPSSIEFHDGFSLLHSKLENYNDKIGGVLEMHGKSLSLLTEKMAGLDSHLGSLKENLDIANKSMRAQLFLASRDSIPASADNLAESYGMVAESSYVLDDCSEPQTKKTKAVRFVDLGAVQLDPSQSEESPRKTVSNRTVSSAIRQRLVSGFESLPEFGPLHSCNRVLTFLSTMLVVANAIFIGWSVNEGLHALLKDEAPPRWIDGVEIVFGFALFVDLVLRILTWGKSFITDRSERWWNLFDFLLVMIAIVEPFFGDYADVKASRKFPAIRIFRALRVLRVVRQLGTLRLMFAMITHAFLNVMWAFVFIMMFTYMTAVMFMQVTANKIDEIRGDHPTEWMAHVKDQMSEEWVKSISESFGDLRSSCVTLVGSISGGNDWLNASQPMLQIGQTYQFCYMLFVMFMIFGLMNILTGIFVANTNEVSRVDRELVIRSQLKDRKSFANQLKKVLRSIDKDDNGTISKQELIEHLYTAEMEAYLKTLDVTVSDAQGVFKLLDVRGLGEVDINEFVLSLMRFQGSARAVDVATLVYEGKRNEARWSAYMDYIEEQFDVVKRRLQIDSKNVGTVQAHVDRTPAVRAFSIPMGTVEDMV